MKNYSLTIIVIATISTQCFAHVKSSPFFSSENTLWLIGETIDLYYGFSGGIVYFCSIEGNSCIPLSHSSYNVLPLGSIFSYHSGNRIGYLLPLLGIGIAISSSGDRDFLVKVTDNWTP